MITYHTEQKEIEKLAYPCKCFACENPCRYGSGALADDDLTKMSKLLGMTESEVKEKYLEETTKFNTTLLKPRILRKDMPYGRCIFFSEGKGCTVHGAKPTECRVAMGCKDYGENIIIWFHLNHYLNPKDPESIRQYKIYVETGGKVLPGAEIDKIATKELLAKIDKFEDIVESRKKDWDKILGTKEAKDGK